MFYQFEYLFIIFLIRIWHSALQSMRIVHTPSTDVLTTIELRKYSKQR